MVNKVVSFEQLEQATNEFAERLIKAAPGAVGLAKTVINRGLGADLRTANESEIYAQSLCMQTKDLVEALTAYMQKREPKFRGK